MKVVQVMAFNLADGKRAAFKEYHDSVREKLAQYYPDGMRYVGAFVNYAGATEEVELIHEFDSFAVMDAWGHVQQSHALENNELAQIFQTLHSFLAPNQPRRIRLYRPLSDVSHPKPSTT